MRETRRAHFRVRGLFDGKHEASILIEDNGHEPLFTVRPLHGRPYTLRLTDVAAMVHARVVKQELGR